MRVFDITVHAWDLARAVGLDERIDPALVAVALDIAQTATARGGIGFGITPLGLVDSTAAPLDQRLDLSGRQH